MASTFSPILRIELIGTGDQSGTWGNTTNVNLGTLIEQAIAGTATIDVTAGNVTLTNYNGASDESRCMALHVTGLAGVARNIVAPAVSKLYVVSNVADAAVTIKTSSSTGLSVPVNETYLVYYDPVDLDFKLVGTASTNLNTPNTLVKRDGSGNFAAGTITANIVGNLNGNLTSSTATATTQSPGDNTTRVATTAFVTSAVTAALQQLYPVGSIYTSTVGTNPAALFGFGTWVAFGAGRVLMGDGGGFSAGQTGGSADAIVVSHTHTGTTSTVGNHSHGSSGGGFFFRQGAGGPINGIDNGNYFVGGIAVVSTTADAGSHNHTFTTASAGSSATNANLQPYVVVYMWNRIA